MCGGGGGWGVGEVDSSRVKVTSMIEGFAGFEIFPSGIFRVGKFGKYIFGCPDLVGSL